MSERLESAPEPPVASHDRGEFEALLVDISARLITAAPEQVDDAILSALEQVRRFFRADRCGLMSVASNGAAVHVRLSSYAEGITQMPPEINVAELFPWARDQLLVKRFPVVIQRMTDLPPEAAVDRATFDALGTKAQFTVPITLGSTITHLMVVAVVKEGREWPLAYIDRLRVLGEMMVSALHRAEAVQQLRAAVEELKSLRDRLTEENVYLRRDLGHGVSGDLIAGRSPAVRRAMSAAAQVAPTGTTVLLLGETGTGKERFASFIHHASPRGDRTMVRVNCSAIPGTLIESELFGREKGAYTGALSKQIGRFELANGSTLFLDEIGELPIDVQVKLLRVLEDLTIERLGSPRRIPVDVRIITATNRNLEDAVRVGRFRADLYYRLNVFPIVIPPLRERREDIPALVDKLVEELGSAMGKRFDSVTKASMAALQGYDWPGNVRELRNVLERAMILSPGPTLAVTPPDVTVPATASTSTVPASGMLSDVERRHILRVLERTGWRIRGRHAAAELLGLKPTTLEARMRKLGIQRPGTSAGPGHTTS